MKMKMKTLLPLFSILLLLVLPGSASPTTRPRTPKTIHVAIDPIAHGDLPSSSYKKTELTHTRTMHRTRQQAPLQGLSPVL